MELMLLLFVIGWASREVYHDVTGKMRDNRAQRVAEVEKTLPKGMSPARRRAAAAKHDTAWTAREILTGFPASRAAWSSAWLAHKADAEQHRHRRQMAKVTFIEAKNARRQAMAKHPAAGSPAASRPAPTPQPAPRHLTSVPANGNGSGKVLPGPWSAQPNGRHAAALPGDDDGRGAAQGIVTGPSTKTFPSIDDAHAAAKQASITTGQPVQVTDGDPNKNPVKVLGKYVSGQWIPEPQEPEQAKQEVDPVRTPSLTSGPTSRESIPGWFNGGGGGGGNGSRAEFPYAQTLEVANQTMNLAESHQAEMGKVSVPQMVDSLSGSGLDSDTLGRAADFHDAWKAAQETQKRLIDTAQAFRGAVERHAPVADAHQSAPGGGAEKGFYVES